MSINLEKILLSEPQRMVNMMCYLAHDCETCPVERTESQTECKRKLYMNDEKGMLWCKKNQVDCAWMRDGECRAPRCNIKDIEYIEKSRKQEARRAELHAQQLAKKNAEKGKTERELIEEEVRFLRRHVQNCYARGWTKLGDRESEYLARLERKLARR